MNRRSASLLLLAAAAVMVWLAADELPWAARALTTFLLVPLPALLVVQARMLAEIAAVPRLSVYASSALAQWLLALLAAAAATSSGMTSYSLGLAPPPSWMIQLGWAGGVTAVAVAVNLISYRLGVRESAALAHLLPRSGPERLAFAGLSLTAGICEELVFRGFLMTAIYATSGSLTLALLVSSVTFGVVHAYQEPGGVARATLLGLLLALPYVSTGSLVASMLAHTAIDLIGGCWLGPRLLRSSDS